MKIFFKIYEIEYPDSVKCSREVGDQYDHYNQPGAVLYTEGHRFNTEQEAENEIKNKSITGNFVILKVYEK